MERVRTWELIGDLMHPAGRMAIADGVHRETDDLLGYTNDVLKDAGISPISSRDLSKEMRHLNKAGVIEDGRTAI